MYAYSALYFWAKKEYFVLVTISGVKTASKSILKIHILNIAPTLHLQSFVFINLTAKQKN